MVIEEKSMSELRSVGSLNYGVDILKVKYNISKRFLEFRRFEISWFISSFRVGISYVASVLLGAP